MFRLSGALRREQIRAAGVLGAPMLLALALWAVVVAADGERVTDAVDVAPEPTVGAGSVETSDDEAPGTDDAGAVAAPGQADRAAESDAPVVLQFDDMCEVEVEPDEQDDELRPWQFAECEHAPIPLAGSEKRWIVVVASLWGNDFSEREAQIRVEARGGGAHLLWSSHYPSLNPNLWVVAEGPFGDEETAERAADRIGGGAYARALSDDEGDRYCIADDGCVGETRPVRLD